MTHCLQSYSEECAQLRARRSRCLAWRRCIRTSITYSTACFSLNMLFILSADFIAILYLLAGCRKRGHSRHRLQSRRCCLGMRCQDAFSSGNCGWCTLNLFMFEKCTCSLFHQTRRVACNINKPFNFSRSRACLLQLKLVIIGALQCRRRWYFAPLGQAYISAAADTCCTRQLVRTCHFCLWNLHLGFLFFDYSIAA